MDAAGTNANPRKARYFMAVPSIQDATAMLLDVSARRKARKLLTYYKWTPQQRSPNQKRALRAGMKGSEYSSVLQLEPGTEIVSSLHQPGRPLRQIVDLILKG